VEHGVTLERRLANFRSATRPRPLDTPWSRAATADLPERMAAAVDGEVVRTPLGTVVRCEQPVRLVAVDRERLARLPGQPPPDVPLVCLDTETTGLATAAGTVAFLIGLGWWEGDGFRQVQLLLPDHADEPALLELLARHIPAAAWLVTYNGRGFDWPLLVTRYRMARRAAPDHAGHLDLLPLVRRVFRHRMVDARLRTAEAALLGLVRIGDVDGWQIPGRYLDFLRGGPADPLVEVVRHNDQDVRSLAHLVRHVERGYADPVSRSTAPRGDLAGLARAFARVRRLDEALECLDAAIAAPPPPPVPAPETILPFPSAPQNRPLRVRETAEDWWQPTYRPDYGGPARRAAPLPALDRPRAFASPWTEERLYLDRAHVLRRLGRIDDACEAWAALAASPGRLGVLAAIELSKLREHRLGDPVGALEAATRGLAAAERRRRIGRPEPALELNLDRRLARLRRRLTNDR
jgi:tetratricopeptide (TPR) repeat protein